MLLPVMFAVAAVQIQPDSAGVEFRQPQLAAGRGVAALTFGAGKTIYFTASRDNGRTFAKPVKVAETSALALGRHRGPRVSIVPGGIVITAVAGGSQTGDLLAWRSTDDGKSWSAPRRINDTAASAREGLHAIATDRSGHLFAVWLDLRDKGTRLYGSSSEDGGLAWSKNVLVYESPDGTICQCCHPTVAIGPDGAIYVMWRNALGGSRDLYLSKSQDGKRFDPAQKLGAGTWRLDACPMDGGGLTFESGDPVSVWRRAEQIYMARPGEPETELGAGKDAAAATGAKGLYVAWSTAEGIQLREPGSKSPALLESGAGFVTLTPLPDGSVLAAWERHGSIGTRILP